MLCPERMHRSLLPYVDPKPIRTWRYLLAGALVGLIGSRIAIALLDHTTEDVARATAQKLALEAYPEWRAAGLPVER